MTYFARYRKGVAAPARELAFTQLTVLDTFEVMIRQTSRMLEAKSRRLKWALVSLTTGAVMAAIDLTASVQK